MMSPNVQALLQLAVAHLQSGRITEAQTVLWQVLQLSPDYSHAHFMLGTILHRNGKFPEAIHHLQQALALQPAVPEPLFLMGLIFQQQRQLPQAIDSYRKFLAAKPDDGKALNNLGRALLDIGRIDLGKQTLERAVVVAPQNSGAINNLGEAFRMIGDAVSAEALYRRAIAVDPNCGEAFCNLGIILSNQKQTGQSIASFQRAIAINPKSFNARFNLTRALQDAGELDAALAECRMAIDTRPTSGEAYNVLGNLYGFMGEVPQCIAAQTKAVQLQPDHAANHSNLLLSLQYRDDLTIEQRLAAHRQWDQQHIAKLAPIDRPVRIHHDRIRIGYVSPNFQTHSVAYFFEPVLAAHDRSKFEIYCYSNTKSPDAATGRFRALSEHWRDITKLTDAAAVKLIADDEIDILIDLAGHTAGNRLPIFGCKPAPVQMTWIGYPDTTGMTAIDYRLTDGIADPPGSTEQWHTEKLLRIDRGCWAYTGPENAPLLGPPPMITNGFVTFGSFNNLPKVSPEVLKTWAEILKEVPGSRLALKAAGLRGQLGRDYVLRNLRESGIESDRVMLLNWAPSTASHLELYNRIDIALDTFPYNGTTTTCEALWMGVPVITFPGNRHVCRVGASLLKHAGCEQWIAEDVADYVAKSVKLAAGGLQTERAALRDKIKQSPLGNADRVARELERLFSTVLQAAASGV